MFKIQALVDFVVHILNAIYGVVGNYGIAIIIVTVLMRIIIFPLTLKQEKSMKKMRELQPELEKIKEKYKDNPQEYQQKTAELYRESGVNPLGGCLPLLIQMPVFVALYWAFSGNAIPADAKFLWFTLKQPDRLFMIGNFAFNLLPILNVGVTYIQQKIMTSATSGQESSQQMQTMLYMMPLMMLFIFYKMPSGVTLYYLVSGALSLVQQYFILKGRSDDGKDNIKSSK
ncbi:MULTISPECIES: YidC/Oxa1 family membrane protein insertase [Leptotrichia]|jgi:membrane protein insertase, yidC/oxa1 family|uniref:YidC/Oxa1 family membrane protein insertase n=1 Tax=Leptotrichia TaxID=32067 RepID=UPI0015B86622|nr:MULTISPECIES: YidC/Oxa1 family membrane protein insertase [Leptotrichia]NWO26171.1 membrane protein insertase YidC [Leptotrichia sp. oral taxon 417]VTX54515.1 Membrane protein insertase YidC 2 [uncultured Leptotrichia sp.]